MMSTVTMVRVSAIIGMMMCRICCIRVAPSISLASSTSRGSMRMPAKKIVMMSVHSKVKTDLTKLKDAVGRPLLVDATAGTAEIPRIQGLPVFESDFNKKSADVPPKYDTLLLQRGALALWHSLPTVKIWQDPRSETNQIILWVYYIAYRYKSLPGGSKPGVLILRTR